MRHLLIILTTLLLFSGPILKAQNFSEIMKAVPADRAADDQFGNAVSISGEYAVVAAFSDDFPGSENHGSVHIYKRIGMNDWIPFQKLFASDQEDYDRFGYSVDIDGDYLIVGAYHDDEDATGANTLSNAGSAYIFEKDLSGNWIEVQKIVASDRAIDDEFGFSVAISGNTAIVGAQAEDHDAAGNNYIYSSGSVYVFERDGFGNWTQQQKLVASDRSPDINYPGGYSGEDLGDQFGWSVGISGDYLVVGALHHDYGPSGPPTGALWSSGAAYIFERTAGTWNQVQKIQNFDRESWDRFGAAVAIDTNVIVVGAYSEDELADGASGELTNPGSAYLFERNLSGNWTFMQKINPADRNSGDHFGWSFGLEDTLLVVGTHSDDHDETGGSLAADAGSAYIFVKNSGTWTQLQKIDASDRVTGDEFGVAVGLSGHTILVGAFYQDFNDSGLDSLEDAGAAYFFSNEFCPFLETNQAIDLCFGDSYTIGSNTYTSSGNYSDTLVSVEGCDSTVHTLLSISPDIFSSDTVSVCHGSGYWIGGTYYTASGTYPVIYTAVNSCDSTVYTTLIVEPEITAFQDVSICYGESYTIGLNTYMVSGVYTDVVSATNFCDSVITTNLVVQLPVNKAVSQSVNWITAAAADAGYQWMDCETGLIIPGENNQLFIAEQTGSYAVIVTENGCTDTSACVYVDQIASGMPEDQLERLITVYPNPNKGDFSILIDTTVKEELQFSLVDANGCEIQLIRMQNNRFQPVVAPAPGIYFLVISSSSSTIGRKIIVN